MQVEFNKAALSLAEAIPQEQKKAALNRLLKVGQASICHQASEGSGADSRVL